MKTSAFSSDLSLMTLQEDFSLYISLDKFTRSML